jgi:hypothetical protein
LNVPKPSNEKIDIEHINDCSEFEGVFELSSSDKVKESIKGIDNLSMKTKQRLIDTLVNRSANASLNLIEDLTMSLVSFIILHKNLDLESLFNKFSEFLYTFF